MIRFRCPACQAIHQVENNQAGAKVHCGICGQRLQVPRQKTVLALIDTAPSPASPLQPPKQPDPAWTGVRIFWYIVLSIVAFKVVMFALVVFLYAVVLLAAGCQRQPSANLPGASKPARSPVENKDDLWQSPLDPNLSDEERKKESLRRIGEILRQHDAKQLKEKKKQEAEPPPVSVIEIEEDN